MTRPNVTTNLLLNCICHWSRLPTQYIIIIIIIVEMLLSTTKVVKSLKLISSKNHK